MTSTVTPTPTRTRGHRVRTVLTATASAAVAWAVAAPLLGVDLTVNGFGQPMPIGLGAIVATSLVASLAGWAWLAVLERFSNKPQAIWTATAIVAFLVSLVPVTVVEASGAAKATLAFLHLVVAAVLILRLTRPTSRMETTR